MKDIKKNLKFYEVTKFGNSFKLIDFDIFKPLKLKTHEH